MAYAKGRLCHNRVVLLYTDPSLKITGSRERSCHSHAVFKLVSRNKSIRVSSSTECTRAATIRANLEICLTSFIWQKGTTVSTKPIFGLSESEQLLYLPRFD